MDSAALRLARRASALLVVCLLLTGCDRGWDVTVLNQTDAVYFVSYLYVSNPSEGGFRELRRIAPRSIALGAFQLGPYGPGYTVNLINDQCLPIQKINVAEYGTTLVVIAPDGSLRTVVDASEQAAVRASAGFKEQEEDDQVDGCHVLEPTAIPAPAATP